jgi:hypothetical protein
LARNLFDYWHAIGFNVGLGLMDSRFLGIPPRVAGPDPQGFASLFSFLSIPFQGLGLKHLRESTATIKMVATN